MAVSSTFENMKKGLTNGETFTEKKPCPTWGKKRYLLSPKKSLVVLRIEFKFDINGEQCSFEN